MNSTHHSNIRFIVPENDKISSSITKTWTEQAILCYSIKSECRNCDIGKNSYSFVCQMPKVVEILLKDVGPPPVSDKQLA